jgi:hypothetical protein
MKRNGLVALSDLVDEPAMPSRALLFALVKTHKIPRYKFPGDRKTYVHRIDIERALQPQAKRLPKQRKPTR